MDDEIYKAVDEFIQQHSGQNIAFRINNNRFGDYEYGVTRDWFNAAYRQARQQHPARRHGLVRTMHKPADEPPSHRSLPACLARIRCKG